MGDKSSYNDLKSQYIDRLKYHCYFAPVGIIAGQFHDAVVIIGHFKWNSIGPTLTHDLKTLLKILKSGNIC